MGGDDLHAEFETQPIDEHGAGLAPPATTRVPWTELQSHASYPEDQTTIELEALDITAGRLTCWKYAVDDGGIVSVAWFPVDSPGPPARKVDTVDGVEVATMTLRSYVDPRD